MSQRNKPRFATNTDFTEITMPVSLLQDPNLTMSQKIVFAFITAGFIGTQKELAVLAGADRRSIGDRLLELTEKGYIEVQKIGLYNIYTVTEQGE